MDVRCGIALRLHPGALVSIPPASASGFSLSKVVPLYELERDELRMVVLDALIRCDGEVTRAAWQLGVARSKFYLRIKELELWPELNEIRRKNKKEDHLDKHSHRFIHI